MIIIITTWGGTRKRPGLTRFKNLEIGKQLTAKRQKLSRIGRLVVGVKDPISVIVWGQVLNVSFSGLPYFQSITYKPSLSDKNSLQINKMSHL